MFKSILITALMALCLLHSAVAGVPQHQEARAAAGVCSNGIYGELSIVARYPPAVAFCSKNYPVKCTSSKVKRAAATTPSTTPKKISTTAPTTSLDATASAYSKCLKQPASIISTLCSCIQTPKACPTSKTTTSTSSSRTTSTPATSTSCSPSQSTFCTRQTQNICQCQLDTDGVTPVCSNGAACPQSNFPNPPPPCASDADCALVYPGSVYNRCVYTDKPDFCGPTFCATEDGCAQQRA